MKMKPSRFILVQLAVFGIALGAGNPPPLPSYNFGITGEPTKVDTAFGNLGKLGPVYDVPEARNDSTASSRGEPQLSITKNPIKLTTEPPEILQPTTAAQTQKTNISNVKGPSTVKTTNGEAITLLGSGSALNATTSKEEPFESSTLPIPAHTFEITTVSKERPTLITTESRNNVTSNSINIITAITSSTGASSNSSASSSKTPSTTSSTQGNMLQTTPQGPPSQTFHTGPPNSTVTPIIIPPGDSDTKPDQNHTIPSKPNSSLSLHPGTVNIWLTLTVVYIYLRYK